MKTVPDQFLEDLDLHLSHQLCMDLAKLAVPQNMKFRFLFLKLPQFLQHLVRVAVIRKLDLIVQNRLQNRKLGFAFYAKSFTWIGSGQSCHSTDGSCLCFCDRCIFGS